MPDDPRPNTDDLHAARRGYRAETVVLLYASFAALWILLSDKVVAWLFNAPDAVTAASIIKGWTFVVVTSLFLYGLLRRLPGQDDPSTLTETSTHAPRWPLLLLTVSIVGLTFGGIGYTLSEEKAEQSMQLLTVANLKARLVADWLRERHADAEIIRATPLFADVYRRWRDPGEALHRDRVVGLLEAYIEQSGFYDAMLLAPRATLAWSVLGDRSGIGEPLRDAVERAHQGDAVVRLGPYRGAERVALIDYVIPLDGRGADDPATLVLRIDPRDHLYPLLENWPLPMASSETLLFRRDADQVHFLNDLRHRGAQTHNDAMPLATTGLLSARVLRSEDDPGQVVEALDYRGVPIIGVVVPIAGTDWFLLSKVDRREVYERVFTEILWVMLVGMLTLAAAAAATRLARNRHVLALALQQRQRDELLRQMSAMARIGAWEFDPATGRGSWTEETARIHEVPPEQEPSAELGLSFFAGEWRHRIETAVEQAIASGLQYDLELELVTAKGNRKWVRTIGLPVLRDGRVVRVHGAIQDITERKRTELALERERGLLKTLIGTLPDLVWLKDPDGVYITCNPRFERFFGASEAQIVGRSDYDFVDRELADAFRKYDLAAIAAGGPSVNREEIRFADDGHRELVETVKTPMYDGQGRLIGVLGIARDITALHQAQEALRIARDRNQRYLDTVQSTMVAVDLDGRITMLNRAGCALLGYREQELLGRNWFETCLPQPEGMQEVYPVFRAILESGVAGSAFEYYENTVQCRDGRHRLVAWHTAVIVDDLGQITGVLASGEDVTERRAAEAQLRKLSLAVEQSFESIVITDLDGNIEYVNQAFLDNTGFSRDQVIGQNPRLLQSGHTPRETYDEMWAALTGGRPWKGTFHNRRRDGSEYVEFAIVSPIREADGRITHYVAAKEDVTEKQRVARELDHYRQNLEELVLERTSELAEARECAEAASRAKSAFLANMSHEIRTPMNGVIGLLEVLERSGLSEQQGDLVATIRQSAGTLLGLIDDILDFSKIEAGRMDLEHLPVAIAEIVEGVCSSLAVSASQKGVDLHVFVDPQIPVVMSDSLRLRQVLYNLVGNAIKFTAGQPGRQGHVWVAATVLRQAPLRLRFHVDDNGIGMSAETVAGLFTAFSQAEASTTRRFGGTGLGLAICKRVVGLMEGEIAVESAPDQGARFTVDLPFERAAEQPSAPAIDLAGVHGILVEGDRRETDGIAVYLAHAGADVSRVPALHDLPAALDRTASPRVVVCPEDADEALLSGDGAALPAEVPVILIAHGRRRGPCAELPNALRVYGDGLRRQVLLRSVAVALGRASPEIVQQAMDDSLAGRIAAAPSIAEARAQGRLILVAEDDAINQMVILQQLDLLGFAAEVAQNGAEALDLWRDGGYALLLTDLHMPVMDGYQLTAAIRREETAGRMPVLALTANAMRGEAQRTETIGMDDYLIKPVLLERLKQALDRWLPEPAPAATGASKQAPEERARAVGQPVDPAVLRELVGDDDAIIHGLLISYRDNARRYAAALHEAAASGDVAEVGAIAHKLKSASRSVGALALGDLCACLENAARTDDTQSIERSMKDFAAAFAAADEAIGRLVQES